MEKDIDSRYQSIDEMLADLHRFKKESSISTNTVSAIKRNKNKKRIKTAIISSIILVFAIAAFYLTRPILFGEGNNNIPITIAVVGFENQSGDSTYNYLQKAIPNLLITNLEQSNHLQVTTWERMHDLLKQMNENEVDLINKDLGFEICRFEGIDAIVIGSFVKAGNMFATDVKVLDAGTKKLIKSANIKSEGLAGILESQIDYLSEEIVKGVVQSAGEIESVQLRIADVSTTSMEAYKQFLKGKEEFERIYYYEALEHFERAIQIDSTFALAHLYLGLTQYYVYEVKKFKNSFSNAEKYKNTATEREKIYIEALYPFMIDNNIDKSINILEKGVTRYPNEKMMHFWLAYNYYMQRKYSDVLNELTKVLKLDPDYGLAYKLIGKTYGEKEDFEKALDYTKKYVSIYPQNADSYYSLGFLFFRMGKIDQAIDQLKMSFQIKEDFGPSAILPTLFSLKEDYSETLRWENKISSLWNKESMNFASTWWGSFYYYWTGNIKKTLFTLEKMLRENSQIEAIWIARANWLRGWIYYDRGDYEKSRQYFNRFLNQEYKNRYGLDTAYISTMNYFYQGIVGLKMGKIDSVRINLEQMKSISNEINTDYPYNIRSYYNLLYGMVLIKEDSLNKAEDILKNNPPFKLHSQRLSSWGMISIFIDPLLQDDLARIYAKKGDLDKAIDVYEELISQDLEVRGFHLIHPKYHYRLAKLYEEKGRMEKAISEYEKFLKIYINADKDLPDYIDAKRRLSKLVAK